MIELRPNCELCDKDLPPSSAEARICTYECTYCAECVETILKDVCPTCGGNFMPRPIRPKHSHRSGKSLGLLHHPAITQRTHSQWTKAEINEMTNRLKDVPPDQR